MSMDGPRFTLQHKLHEGQHALIFRGVRTQDHTPVVVKLLKGDYPSPRALAQLRREFETLRELDLPGVIKAYSLEVHGDGLALVMEDAGGVPLSDVIRDRPLPLRQSLEIALSAARTLGELHQRSLVHKDIKPHNILLDPVTGAVKLIDFGIAMRLTHELARPHGPDALEGTLLYMSPEQSGRMNRVVDPRTDLYSLGVTLYELLTGTLPFAASDAMELIHSHIARTPAPPRTRAPWVPQVVSDIVLRLLAKAPEDRYQHALGLAADLATCLATLDDHGDVAAFELARHDLPETLRVPQKLYGRDADVAALMAATSRIRTGRPELVLITGPAGVGKSALVLEIHKAIARGGGRLAAGKFDLLQRSTPFGALARAFGELVLQVLSGSPAALADWRTRLRHALGANAPVIVDIVPELALILGPQPAAPPLRPTESQNRFNLAFQDFARACGDPGAPLVLFLDDLQWADPASLSLLRLLLADHGGQLLVVGAYRDGEVDGAHGLTAALHDLRADHVPISELRLRDLGLADVRALLVDCLGRDDAALTGLADVAFAKTHGNPFFLSQFLLTLHGRGLLALDRASARWTWDERAIAAAPITDNVVEFMADKLRELPPEARRLLAVGACIGNEFDLAALARISGRSLGRVVAELWPALRAGLLVPQGGDYRLISDRDDEPLDASLSVTCKFLHDRVQQAALSLVSADEAALAHLNIGRGLRDAAGDELRGDVLFTVVRHLDAALPAISDPAERRELARLNLAAGQAAKASTAHAAAAEFLTTGIDLLPADAWDSDYALAFALRRELAETDYLAARFEPADALFAELQVRARTTAEKADLLSLRLLLLNAAGRYLEGVHAARAGLALFGDSLPPITPEAIAAAFGELLGAIAVRMQGRTIESLIDAPPLTDPDLRAHNRLLGDAFGPAFLLDPRLGALVMLKQVVLALDHGHDTINAYGYVSYAYILSGPLANQVDALRFAELALRLLDKYPSPESACRVHFMFGFVVGHTRPIRTALPHFRGALQAGSETGEFMYMSQAVLFLALTGLRIGDDLPSVRAAIDRTAAVLQRTRDALATAQLVGVRNTVDALETRTWWGVPLAEQSPEETAWLAGIDAMGLIVVHILHLIHKLVACTLLGERAVARRLVRELAPIAHIAAGAPYLVDFPFYAALTLIAAVDEADDRAAALADVAVHRDAMAVWAANCPANEQHRLLILDAELARLRGDDLAAMDTYDRAIELARAHDFPHHEALAAELCGEFHLARRRGHVARAYLAQARHGYERWGAAAKVRELEARHPFLATRSEPGHGATTGRLFDTSSRSTGGNQGLDLGTVIKASHAFTAEIELQPLLEQIVRIVVENAGARRGVLLLDHDGQLHVAAESSADTGPYTLGQPVPLREADNLPASVIHYVAHTSDSVILDDAARDPRFAADPYLDARAPRSLLCVPLILKARLIGALYLENDLTQGVFAATRLEAIKLIATQAAISIENANLYADMERRVRERTDELSRVNDSLIASNAELDAFARTVAHDLKNPLGAIAGYSELLLETLQDLPPGDATRVVDNIRRASATAASIVDELLLLAGVRKQQVESTRLDMHALVARVEQRLTFMLREHGGELSLPDRWPTALGHAPWIEEAWINYLSNGLKYGSPRLTLGWDAQPDGQLRFWVRDHGPGIPADAQGRLFAEFTRLGAVRTEGHGLGLSIVRRIVERLGGRVGVASEVGTGSEFWFSLPAADPA